MSNEKNFETYLVLSDKNFEIFVEDTSQNKKIFQEKLIIEKFDNQKEFELLNKFLDKNVFKIEKIIQSFVNNIIVIIDDTYDLRIGISLKKKYYNNLFTKDDFNHLLQDAHRQIKENHNMHIIAHMILVEYLIDDINHKDVVTDVNCENVRIELNFICFTKTYINNLENILNKFHIKIKNTLSARYLRDCFENDKIDIFSMCRKIIDGHNKNEIFLVPKLPKIKGFFEKFFNFFN